MMQHLKLFKVLKYLNKPTLPASNILPNMFTSYVLVFLTLKLSTLPMPTN